MCQQSLGTLSSLGETRSRTGTGARARLARAGRRRMRDAVAAVLGIALLAIASGCRERGSSRGDAAGVRRYTVRGEVVQLRQAPTGARHVGIRHEAIDDFVNEAGATVGMSSMVMTFEAAPEVSLDDVRVGDKVEFVLAVGWSPPSLRIEQLRELPPETVLEFREARPKPAPAPAR